jgi:hypothetical protein
MPMNALRQAPNAVDSSDGFSTRVCGLFIDSSDPY